MRTASLPLRVVAFAVAAATLAGCFGGAGDSTDTAPAPTEPSTTAAPTSTAPAAGIDWTTTYDDADVVLEVTSKNMSAESQAILGQAVTGTREYLFKAWERVGVDNRHEEVLSSWAPLLHPDAPYDKHERGPVALDWEDWAASSDRTIWADDGRFALWNGVDAAPNDRWLDDSADANHKIVKVVAMIYETNRDYAPGIVRRKSDGKPVAVWVPWLVEIDSTLDTGDGEPYYSAIAVHGTAEFRQNSSGNWVLWDPRPMRGESITTKQLWGRVAVNFTDKALTFPWFIRPATNDVLLCGSATAPAPLVGAEC